MADDEHDYKVGPGRPPLRTRFKKGQSGNPGGRRRKNLPAPLTDALNEPIFVTIDGERRKITKREAVVPQIVNKSTTADLRATKMLFDLINEAEHKAGCRRAAARPAPVHGGGRGGGGTIHRADTTPDPDRDGREEGRDHRFGRKPQ
jgi:Family of unknown function (DUF5681)